MILIGLLGAAGAGKSTFAQILVEKHGYTRMRMADVLKNMLRVAGLTDEEIDGSRKTSPSPLLGGKTPRWAMQSLGTEWGRECLDDDFWVRAMEAKLDQLPADAKIVIDDIRFQNELDMIERRSGVSVLVRRPSVEPRLGWWARLMFWIGRPQWSGLHASEVFWRQAETDLVFRNVYDGIDSDDIDEIMDEIEDIQSTRALINTSVYGVAA